MVCPHGRLILYFHPVINGQIIHHLALFVPSLNRMLNIDEATIKRKVVYNKIYT